jgi:hypothetical protein
MYVYTYVCYVCTCIQTHTHTHTRTYTHAHTHRTMAPLSAACAQQSCNRAATDRDGTAVLHLSLPFARPQKAETSVYTHTITHTHTHTHTHTNTHKQSDTHGLSSSRTASALRASRGGVAKEAGGWRQWVQELRGVDTEGAREHGGCGLANLASA